MSAREMPGDADFVLASGSPRRKDLLGELGYRFLVRPAAIDERAHSGEAPHDYVARLAREKAIAARMAIAESSTVVLAADTIVALDDALLGKPENESDAASMLGRLSGRAHEVMTGVAVARGDAAPTVEVVSTRVVFATIDAATIRAYVATGEPHDKAGAYAIQGHAAAFIERIEGNYSNVVGLPLPTAVRLLDAAGVPLSLSQAARDRA